MSNEPSALGSGSLHSWAATLDLSGRAPQLGSGTLAPAGRFAPPR